MTSLAVIAHEGKSFGGGLAELERLLGERGFADATWYRVTKSKKSPAAARKAIDAGVDLVLVWGGDGMAQRCLDVLGGTGVRVGLLPAGTANLLATSLGIPRTVAGALDVALGGTERRLDLGVLNGERFAVMAGAGLDALTMKQADGALKERLGRLAYVWTGTKAARAKSPKAQITVDGTTWFKGRASCLLFGNMGSLGGGLTAFPDASPDDGILEVGVVTAQGLRQWARVTSMIAVGRASQSRFVQTTRGKDVRVRFNRPVPCEVDGGARRATRSLRVGVEPHAAVVCVPEAAAR